MTNAKNVKVNDLMAIVNYVKVNNKVTANISGRNHTRISVTDLDSNMKFDVTGDDLVNKMLSADQFNKTEKKNKTELAEILIAAWNKPVTVCFLKQDNSERILRGRLVSSEHLLGRSMMEDLDLDQSDPSQRLRQVDHRTIKYIIVDGIKYESKK